MIRIPLISKITGEATYVHQVFQTFQKFFCSHCDLNSWGSWLHLSYYTCGILNYHFCNVSVLDFSWYAVIFYFSPSGELFRFGYLCNTNELLLEPLNQLYEVHCYPHYYENLTFSAPKNQDAATILCIANDNSDLGSTWAIPCNNITECDDGSDETGCKFSAWLIPSLLCGSGAVLGITLFVYLHKSIKSKWKKIMQSRSSFQRAHHSIESEKLYKTTILIESGDVDKIHKLYCQEMENNGGEGEAMCHLKVMGLSIKPLSIH